MTSTSTMIVETAEGILGLNWEPTDHKTKAGAAKALYATLRKVSAAIGQDPDFEVWIKSPAESKAHGYAGEVWHVCWESGPHDWGCGVYASGSWGHCETYWGFDLAFYD